MQDLWQTGCPAVMLVLVGGVLVASSLASDAPPPNLIANPSFETDAKGKPAKWATEVWRGEASFEYAAVGRTGGRSVMIASDAGADAGWKINVPVEPYAKYRLSAWIKTENIKVTNGRGALLNLHNLQGIATKALTGTNDWTQVEVVFAVEDQDAVQVNCLFGGWGLATGKAWYDDLRLELVEKVPAPPPPAPRIAIDAAKTGAPISKYIYGQFIEHLGRCIYGGIWAEMLEDRKFYFPVTAAYAPYGPKGPPADVPFPVLRASPWQIVGPADAVTMVKDRPFVGEQTPEVALGAEPRGIAQPNLALRKDKKYVGRIWLAGAAGAGPASVSLIWGSGAKDRQKIEVKRLTAEYAKTPLEFTAGADTDDGRLEIVAAGKGSFRIGTVSLMPADNVQGMRADTLAVLKQLNSPVYRWPGGNFVSGYDWKDGLGDPDRRPPRKNPAWTGVEHNDFGLDEFMTFCRTLATDPYIAVNSGLGGAASAAEEVQYANGAPDTPMGQRRARNGHAEPYKVRFWGIGNEMYGGWQLGHMPLEKYVEKHNEFAKAMRAVDPSIQLVGVGAAGKWSEEMMRSCADHMDLISEHFYCHERPGLVAHVAQIPNAVRGKAEAHRDYRKRLESLKGKDIRIALDEWNYWYGPHPFGELGTRYFLKDALGIAAGLHEFARNSEMFFMANYAQTVNVIGCIKTTKTAAALETTGLVLRLYRERFGVVPAATESAGLVNAMAAWTEDRKTLTLGVVNPTMEAVDIPLEIKGAKLTGKGTRWQIAGADPMAYNDPGQPPRVAIEESPVQGATDKLTVAPCSVTLFALGVE
jgi:alpha-N-arabinofuranosidase